MYTVKGILYNLNWDSISFRACNGIVARRHRQATYLNSRCFQFSDSLMSSIDGNRVKGLIDGKEGPVPDPDYTCHLMKFSPCESKMEFFTVSEKQSRCTSCPWNSHVKILSTQVRDPSLIHFLLQVHLRDCSSCPSWLKK